MRLHRDPWFPAGVVEQAGRVAVVGALGSTVEGRRRVLGVVDLFGGTPSGGGALLEQTDGVTVTVRGVFQGVLLQRGHECDDDAPLGYTHALTDSNNVGGVSDALFVPGVLTAAGQVGLNRGDVYLGGRAPRS